MDKIEMPAGWEKDESSDEWRFGESKVGIYCTSGGWFPAIYGTDQNRDGAIANAVNLARALTPGWVVIEQSKIDTLESMLDAATAREEDLQRELDDAKRLLARAYQNLGAVEIELEQTRATARHPILSRVRRLFGGGR